MEAEKHCLDLGQDCLAIVHNKDRDDHKYNTFCSIKQPTTGFSFKEKPNCSP